MESIHFAKMHGTGNDFIVIEEKNCMHIDDYGKLAKEICSRRFSIGADGLLIVFESDEADIKMSYYNSDGSLAKMCGNGMRCFAKYVYDKKIVNKTKFIVSTLAGMIEVEIEDAGENTRGRFNYVDYEDLRSKTQKNRPLVSQVAVNLGKPVFTPNKIPVLHDGERFINQKLEVDGENYTISSILLGVPHAIIFRDELVENEVRRIGAIIERNSIFPKKTNVNFAKIISRT
ncbi:diaminopimelate epimerase, partial [bacterium AH-315-L21]|nr:diaminopimelate epimerase [bacterium AH-315-L21]